MAEQSNKKLRRLRPATQTVRERAEKASNGKTKRKLRLRVPFGGLFARAGRLKLWKPFKFAARLISRFLVPPYLRNSWKELRLVEWPNRKQTRQLTTAVILFSLVFGIFVAIFDYGLDHLFRALIVKR